MDSLKDLGINLLAALIGFLIARAVARMIYLGRTRSLRRFWGFFRANELGVVISAWNDESTAWEPTGVMGTGDVRALLELQRALLKIGKKFDVVEAQRLHDSRSLGDLVLIGGPGSNIWSSSALRRLKPTMNFHESGAVEDAVTGKRYAASWTTPDQGQDVGLVILATSPFDNDRSLLLLAGNFSHATHAAAKLIGRSLNGLPAHLSIDRPFELIFTVDVVNGEPQHPVVQVARNI